MAWGAWLPKRVLVDADDTVDANDSALSEGQEKEKMQLPWCRGASRSHRPTRAWDPVWRGGRAGPGVDPAEAGPLSVSRWARTRTDVPAAAHGGRVAEAPGRRGWARCSHPSCSQT